MVYIQMKAIVLYSDLSLSSDIINSDSYNIPYDIWFLDLNLWLPYCVVHHYGPRPNSLELVKSKIYISTEVGSVTYS